MYATKCNRKNQVRKYSQTGNKLNIHQYIMTKCNMYMQQNTT